jgi:hypothetical protein
MKADAIVLRCEKVEVGRRGAVFPADLTESEWKNFGLKLAQLQDDINFALADWLNYGREQYRTWRECSEAEAERCAFAVAGTSFAAETLRVCAWVGRKLGPRRNAELSWSHHKEVAQLPPKMQTKFLTLAEENSWSVSELRVQRRLKLSEAGSETPSAAAAADDFPSWLWDARRWLNRHKMSGWSAARRAAWRNQARPLAIDLLASTDLDIEVLASNTHPG